MTALSYRNFSFSAADGPILHDLELDIRGPGVAALLGPSGVGKSTLLRATQRLIDHGTDGWRRSGDILLNGESIFSPGLPQRQLARRIGFIHQKPRMLAGSVFDNVAFALRNATAHSRGRVRELCEKSLEEVGLTWEIPSTRMKAWKLSGGQAQRLAIARALALEPEALLMDEPTASLDPFKAKQIEEIIRAQARYRLVVLVTHDVSLAARLADFVAFLRRTDSGARICEAGPVADVLRRPRDAGTREFIRTSRLAGEWSSSMGEEGAEAGYSDVGSPENPAKTGLERGLLQRIYLFVCGGNTSRSPIAQAVCHQEVARILGLGDRDLSQTRFKALSGGLTPHADRPISSHAGRAIHQFGMRPPAHRAVGVTQEMIDAADAIYCMTDAQCQELVNRFPSASWKLQRLDPLGNLDDPSGDDWESFLATAERIRDLVRWRIESQLRFPPVRN